MLELTRFKIPNKLEKNWLNRFTIINVFVPIVWFKDKKFYW